MQVLKPVSFIVSGGRIGFNIDKLQEGLHIEFEKVSPNLESKVVPIYHQYRFLFLSNKKTIITIPAYSSATKGGTSTKTSPFGHMFRT